MTGLLSSLARDEGYTLSPLPGVRWLRSNRPLGITPVLYEPGIVIVCQGRKRGWLGDQEFVYDEQHVLAVAVPVPFVMQTEASAERPLLAIYLRLDLQLATEIAMRVDAQEPFAKPVRASSLVSSPMDDGLADAVIRLLQAMRSPLETEVLGPSILREIYFRVLTGEQGDTLRAALAARGRFGQIGRAIQRIHRDHRSPLTVAMLAGEAGLGPAAFHNHFKTVTCSSPMQYLKSIRLHQGRLLMMRRGMTAAAAAAAVGYESPSQFSREFKRLFGLPPQAEVDRIKNAFALPPLPQGAYVSSH
ncbi:AraC family transcriptional regulator [Variovorax sp. J2P1-59]|uniref:AraC family transcriptional regulator n=1 Tax=Variovorax flavidus TaxID=3053501 RepID=UPI0025749D20|nr:AraC family transcriptional regulator [Variovorax sp. J2P1-59]MDM0078647.1 AraC family transcriptional regulator [Variovorax sp. J2P1-59]